MHARAWLIAVPLFALGILIGVLSPSLRAQAVADPCAAPWAVVEGSTRHSSNYMGGWHAVKFNRCTGEALVFSTKEHDLDDKDAWRKLPVK